ncbi:MAG: rRNA maturation RNase YbeY [Balneolaceae bacterium]
MTLRLMKMNFPDPSDFSGNPKLEIFNPSEFPLPFDENDIHSALNEIENNEKVMYQHVEIVFVDEPGIVDINKEHLKRDYITDIISFRYDEDTSNKRIEGTLYCCAPRISEQSKEFETPESTEFLRVMIHGLIHLIGYNDQTEDDKKRMTELENLYLDKISQA